MPEPRGPQYSENISSAGDAKPASGIDQEAPKPSQARPEDKDRYASSQRQGEGLEDADQEDAERVDEAKDVEGGKNTRGDPFQQNKGSDQRTQLGQHQDKHAQQGEEPNGEDQEAANPGRDRHGNPDKRAQEKEDHQGEREGLESEIEQEQQAGQQQTQKQAGQMLDPKNLPESEA